MRRECLKIIGTAHASQESVDEVKETICIKDNPLENMRFLNLEFSYHNH